MISSLMLYMTTFISSILFTGLFSVAGGTEPGIATDKVRRSSNVMILLCILPAVFLAALRFDTGTDYEMYVLLYRLINADFAWESLFENVSEPLSTLLNYIAYQLFGSEVGMFFLFNLLTLFFFFKGMLHYRQHLSVTLAVFIFYMTTYSLSLNVMRQLLACAIIFYGFHYIFERRFLRYAALVVLAYLFHKSAILCLPLYFLNFQDNEEGSHKDKVFYLTVFGVTALSPLVAKVINSVMTALNFYSNYAFDISVQGTLGFFLYILPILILVLKYKENLHSGDRNYSFLVRLFSLQLPMQMMANYIPYIDRLAVYGFVAQVLLVPIIIHNIPAKRERIFVTYLMIIWYVFYYYFFTIYLGAGEVYPYQSIYSVFHY